MAIPESQLETWSHQGSIAQSSATYATVKAAIETTGSGYAGKAYKVFLQGSYGNDTNIYSESDVDVVIQLGACFYYDLNSLVQVQKDAFKAAHPVAAAYTWHHFKNDVVAQLQKAFPAAITPGAKAVKIAASGSRRKADVLIATEYRRYDRFLAVDDQDYDEGVCFFNAANAQIANYPRQHSENCTTKHQATNLWFKPMVRVFKNLRSKLVDDKTIASDVAPSYYIEGLLYNVPEDKFGGSYQDTVVKCIDWVQKADRSKLVCAHRQYYLLGDDPNVQWSSAKCGAFLDAAAALWKRW